MKKILTLVVFLCTIISTYSQTINISLEYGGLLNETNQGGTTPITDLEIGDEFYLDVIISNSDNSTYKVTYADIWFTFKNNAFEYLGVDNPNSNSNWYTNQWPSAYIFLNSPTSNIDDLYGQYNTHPGWDFVGDANSEHAPMVISSQTTTELNGVVARLKFRYKQVPNGFDFSQSVMLRKASVRDNTNGYTFTNVKAFPNQTFDNAPPSTRVTAQFKVLFPETLDPTLFDGGLYTTDTSTNDDTWFQPPLATYQKLSSTGTLDITSGFNRTDDFAVIVNWHGIKMDSQGNEYSIDFSEQYSDIVTISDVALAFAELNNGGINQDEFGNEFNYGIQFMNADVNGDGLFNSDDTYQLLLQVIEGRSYLEEPYMVHASKFYPKSEYDNITIETVYDFSNGTTLLNELDNKDNTALQFEYQSAITWRGDINLSHSTQPDLTDPTAAAIANKFEPSYAKSMNKDEREISTSLVTELVDGKVIVTLTLEPDNQKVIGTQYKVKFDSSRLRFDDINFITNNTSTNFSNLKGNTINLGSLIQIKNQFLDEKTKYVLTFTPTTQLENTLGLVTLLTTDAVNVIGEQLKMKME